MMYFTLTVVVLAAVFVYTALAWLRDNPDLPVPKVGEYRSVIRQEPVTAYTAAIGLSATATIPLVYQVTDPRQFVPGRVIHQ